jgi:putative hydrolase of the HAD superfamily
MVLVFDLDDTLYEELTYVKSGFRAVAEYLRVEYGVQEKKVYNDLVERLEGGRGAVFDDVLKKHNIFSKKLVQRCVSVYRLHKPQIRLYPDAVACLKRFRSYPIYIVTDGNKVAQENKIQGLSLGTMVKKYFITHRYGIKNAKPSAYCFEKIRAIEKALPDEVVYIADNPLKDFVGIKPLGYKTIRIIRGNYKYLRPGPRFEAHMEVRSLNELTPQLLKKLTATRK